MKITSKECLNKIQHYINGTEITGKELLKCYENIYKDLDRLEKLEKVIKFLKLNFNISLDSKLRISDDSECVQTFVTYLPENTTIDEMFKTLKEVIEDE